MAIKEGPGMRKLCSISIALLAILPSIPRTAAGQITGATISGVVHSQNGEAVAGAKITIINSSTNQSRETVSDSQGAYRFQSVPVGAYEINVEAENYAKPVARKLTLRVN